MLLSLVFTLQETVYALYASSRYIEASYSVAMLLLTLILRRPVRERYGSTLLPATREQHDQNCTQSHLQET